MASTNYSTVIQVDVDMKPDGLYVLTSKDLPGLLLAGDNVDDLYCDTPDVIKGLYKLNYGMDVEVRRLVEPDELARKIPAEHLHRKPSAWTLNPVAQAA